MRQKKNPDAGGARALCIGRRTAETALEGEAVNLSPMARTNASGSNRSPCQTDWRQSRRLAKGSCLRHLDRGSTTSAIGFQCPPDYVGVTAVTALDAVVGRRVGIRPQTKPIG